VYLLCIYKMPFTFIVYFSIAIIMNYLAHAYLSFNKPEILVGNLISDFVKGKKKFDYSISIQKGIFLHREIDNYTDFHPATREAKEIFRPHYRLYAGAFTDVVFDHFLATDKNEFTAETLLAFSQTTYKLVEPFISQLPEKFQKMFPYMRQQNWLNNYQYAWGIGHSLEGVVRRSAYLTESATAFRLFEQNYKHLQTCYNQFFPELKKFVTDRLVIL
jgi:acyl carrier protein phosphodiesterase